MLFSQSGVHRHDQPQRHDVPRLHDKGLALFWELSRALRHSYPRSTLGFGRPLRPEILEQAEGRGMDRVSAVVGA